MNPRPRELLSVFTLTLIIAPISLAEEMALAPTSQPVIEPVVAATEQPPRRAIRVDELSLEPGFESDGSRRTVKTDSYGLFGPPKFTQRDESRRFEETMGLRSAGAIVDDRVLKYDLMTRWGLSQETYQESSPDGHLNEKPHGDILEYDIHLQAIPMGKVSANATASQLKDRIPRPFLPSLDRTREQYGAQLTYNDAKLPMSLTFEHLYDDMDSGYRDLNDHEKSAEDSIRYEATWQATTNHSLKFNYEYQDTSDRYSGTWQTFNNQRNYLSLLDTLQFGDQGKNRLETLIRDETESGDYGRDILELAPRLTLQHTDSLSTNYGVQWLKESYQNLETNTHRGDIGLTHQLQDLLTSTFSFYGFDQDAHQNADTREWGSLANFAFNKANDLGRFSSNLSYNHTNTETSGGDRDGVVIGEAVTFFDPLPAILVHPDVNRWTVVVTDATRLRVFLPGKDYITFPVGRLTGLSRVPTGQIYDHQTVYVNYVYRTYQDFSLRRDRVDWRIQEDFKNGLTPYYAASLQQEDLSTKRYLLWPDRNINRQRLGTTFKQPRWSMGGEYEYNDDSIDPYQAFHMNGDVTVLRRAEQELCGRLTLSKYDFSGLNELQSHDATLLDMGADWRYVLAKNLEARANSSYRWENDSLYGRTNGVDVRGDVSYKLGYFTLLFEIEYESLHLPGSQDDTFTFWLKLRREIPVIGGGKS